MKFCFNGKAVAMATLAMAAVFAASPAGALTINPTFGTTGGASAFSAADMADINAVISLYEATYTDPITVNITFNNMNSGLGQSNTAFFQDTYANVHAQMIGDALGADDTVALAKLAALPPVADGTMVVFSEANGKALGYTGFGAGQDSVIGLNAGICFNVHTAAGAAANPSKYDLFGVACHELDEALGTVSFVGGSNLTTADFFRYNGDASGNLSGGRSFTTNASANAWFSIDGINALDKYNQSASGDYGDWIKHSPSQVQDWQGTAGVLNDPNVEFRLLDVVGYDRAPVPEPATLTALGLGVAAILRRRKKA